jgi:FixJ family two-component response regulator
MSNPVYSIAIIDDEEPIRRALLRLMYSLGIHATAYASGKEFLSQWHVDPPDCIVLDLQMPGINGLELLTYLRRIGATFPVIMITAHDGSAMREACLGAGADAYLHKPLDEQVLLDAIACALPVAECQ